MKIDLPLKVDNAAGAEGFSVVGALLGVRLPQMPALAAVRDECNAKCLSILLASLFDEHDSFLNTHFPINRIKVGMMGPVKGQCL